MSLNLPLDENLADSINRRRVAEEIRKLRIFNPKERMIGVDVEALNHQMHENILSKTKEVEVENYFAEELRRQANIAELLEQKQNEEIRELNKKIDKFRLSEQRPEYRRDFDLYDPNLLKKECPPRILDTDSCPVSSIQKLDGEDLNFKERTKKQKDQVKDLLLQQMQEKRMKSYSENKEAQDWESMMLKQDYKAFQIAKAEQDNNKAAAKNLCNSNKYLALKTTERRMQQKVDDDYEKKKDVLNNFYSDLLTENPLVARSAFGSHRVIPDRWKGMNKQQLGEYYEGRMQQIIDNKRKEDQKNYETAQWHQQISKLANAAQLLETEEQKQKVETEKKIAMENLQLAQKQKLQQDYLNNVVYSNIPSENYFTQFNTSTR